MTSATIRLCLVISLASVCGCITRPAAFDQCHVSRSDGWVLSEAWPNNRDELLGVSSHDKTVREELSSNTALKEVWFARGSDYLLLCRYEEGAEDSCTNHLESAEFYRAPEGWWTTGVLTQVCVE